jgi:hypothetical protein
MAPLTTADIQSTPTPGDHYFEKVQDPKFKERYLHAYAQYQPNTTALTQIRTWLNDQNESLRILVIGAEWCPDCQRNISALLKCASLLKDDRFQIQVLSGVKTNPLRRTGDKIIWAVPPSPPEVLDPKFAVTKIPMIYIFTKSGNSIGIITENPSHTKTIEEEIVYYLNQVK